jgi:hypothetical protein
VLPPNETVEKGNELIKKNEYCSIVALYAKKTLPAEERINTFLKKKWKGNYKDRIFVNKN